MIPIIGDIGFCYGVKHAIDVLSKASQEHRKVYLTHPLLHNHVENDSLLRQNHAKVFAKGDFLDSSAVVFSAHGHDPKDEGLFPGADLYDATCPLILQRYRRLASLPEASVVFLGKKGHQETEGFLGRFPSFLFVDCKEDIPKQLASLPLSRRTALVPQTTVSRAAYRQAFSWLKKNTELVFTLPICPMYEKRYQDIEDFFRENDPEAFYLVVCGDTLSSNANELLATALSEFPGLVGSIAMRAEDIDYDLLGNRRIVISSSTSASEKSVLLLKRALEEKTGQ